MAKILVIRLSAIGDVAMTIPVIYSAAKANPGDRFTVLTQIFLLPLFINRPVNVDVIGINTRGTEKGILGLLRFAFAYAKYDFDIILDLHSVLRTLIICAIFRLHGKKIFLVDKARKERRRLVRSGIKALVPLRPVVERYADVFRSAGLNYTDTFQSLFVTPRDIINLPSLQKPEDNKWIGIAPFARHQGKIYPIEKMESIVERLSRERDYTVYLFGSRGTEHDIMERWAGQYANVKNLSGQYALDYELRFISRLDLLLCMDSANMHFASLVNAPVLSIWGATHPCAGFYGYGQRIENAIQIDLPCRPCSIYGDLPCRRGDWACMTQISPDVIIDKIRNMLRKQIH